MRLLEKAPGDRHADAGVVLERLQRELRGLTRDDPASVVRGELARTGFVTGERRAEGAPSVARRRGINASRVMAGQVACLVLFAIGVLAIEGGSSARSGLETGNRPLELTPEQAGGLRVIASPWAYVRVDGQQVETTPFARSIPLAPGKHWVTLTHPDAPPIEREILVTTNETVTLDVTMAIGDADDAGKDAR